MFGQDVDVKVWSKDFEFWNLIKICVRTCFFGKQNSTLGSVVPLAMFPFYVPTGQIVDQLWELAKQAQDGTLGTRTPPPPSPTRR